MGIEIDNILENKVKKKIKTGQKGKRGERLICHALNQRFAMFFKNNPSIGMFSRSVGSGNRFGQGVYLSQAATQTFGGDLSCPDTFLFSVESKCGYNNIDLVAAFDGGHTEIDSFLKQASDDAERTKRKAMLLWKKDRKVTLCFIKTVDMPPINTDYVMKYRDWTIINFDLLLAQPDNFFFNVH